MNIRCLACIGGRKPKEDVTELEKGVQIVVGTCGRLLNMIVKGALKTDKIKFLCLDEADEMLSRGYKAQTMRGKCFQLRFFDRTENTFQNFTSVGPAPSERQAGHFAFRYNPRRLVPGHEEKNHEQKPCTNSRQKGAAHARRYPTILHSYEK